MSLINGVQDCKPFVKWAGGKTQLLDSLTVMIPRRFNNYFEPFLGGGAMFFYLGSHKLIKKKALISDTNVELINAYKCLKAHVDLLITKLSANKKSLMKRPSAYYYKLRTTSFTNDIEKAAQFITLNKTCYNGLYRVNKNGVFNVPIGRYKDPLVCDTVNLRSASFVLNQTRAEIDCIDYQHILRKASAGDFVYLDPPFSPSSKTSNFTQYTSGGFGIKDQIKLANVFKSLCKRNCNVILSNSDTGLVRQLYKGFKLTTVSCLRSISCNSKKRSGNTELIISNEQYEL